jgi:hypothetical protein
LITVADAYGIVGQSFDGEVFAELSVDEVGSSQLLLPVTIGFDLVYEDGALLASVSGEITLTISIQIQPTNPTAAMHGVLPYCCVHSATLPLDFARKANVHG